MPNPKPTIERLKENYTINENGCWLWLGYIDALGYGIITSCGTANKVHRIAYSKWIGPIPEGFHVLHKCDVRNCINPKHLFLGTHVDNMQDMVNKGRKAISSGEDHPMARLTEEDIISIRQMVNGGARNCDIAKRYKITQANVYRIKTFQTWKHVK